MPIVHTEQIEEAVKSAHLERCYPTRMPTQHKKYSL